MPFIAEFAENYNEIYSVSRVTILIPHIRGLITPVFTTHEPPSLAHLLAGSVWDWHEVPSQVGNLGS